MGIYQRGFYMKKNGFTLAEVLITLGIVGVISALTLPSLMNNHTKAQIGPKLAKAVSVFEQANQALLNANAVDSLSDARVLTSEKDYVNEFSKYMKITRPLAANYALFDTKDGFSYSVNIKNSSPVGSQPAYKYNIGTVLIDIDGIHGGVGKTVPAKDADVTTWGTDRFYFAWRNDGSLVPWGAVGYQGGGFPAQRSTNHWNTTATCPAGAIPTNAKFCAGHIFENNLKVLYK